jgi:hypothetical protein
MLARRAARVKCDERDDACYWPERQKVKLKPKPAENYTEPEAREKMQMKE